MPFHMLFIPSSSYHTARTGEKSTKSHLEVSRPMTPLPALPRPHAKPAKPMLGLAFPLAKRRREKRSGGKSVSMYGARSPARPMCRVVARKAKKPDPWGLTIARAWLRLLNYYASGWGKRFALCETRPHSFPFPPERRSKRRWGLLIGREEGRVGRQIRGGWGCRCLRIVCLRE